MLPVVAEQHALDPLAIGQFQQQLLGAVLGLAAGGNPRGPDLKLGGQLVADRLGQVGHLLEGGGAPLKQPAPHLPAAIGVHRPPGKPRLQLFAVLFQ